MSKRQIIGPYGAEPSGINHILPTYNSDLATAFNWYNQEKEKKDARAYLRSYVNHTNKVAVKLFDRIPDSEIKTTWGWVARMIEQGAMLSDTHVSQLKTYITKILACEPELPAEKVEEKVVRPSVRDNMKEKVSEYLGELEGAIDDLLVNGNSLDLYADLKARAIPQPYCPFVSDWIKLTAARFISVYESTDSDIKEGYSNLGKRKLTSVIKMLGQWLEDIDKYGQFKKANRKPRAKKVKSPIQQAAKVKYKKEDTELNIKSVTPSEMVGASQVWIYNTKYKKLAVYRSDSSIGIQIKGTTLQNYEPENCEQKTLRKPSETIQKVLTAGKVQLRKILDELSTRESEVNGRINEECVILRVIK